jgi:hypothetical protein
MLNISKSLLALALFFTAFSLSAQTQISIGPRLGINLAKWSTDDSADEILTIDNRLGLLAGGVLELRFNDNLALQPEINFIQKGFKTELAVFDTVPDTEVRFILNYLEIPVLLKVGKSFGSARFDVLAGPSFGYAINGKTRTKFNLDGDESDIGQSVDFEEAGLKRFDMSVQVGAAFTFGLGEKTDLFIDGRYLLGLTNLNDTGDDSEARNRGIAFSAGLLFPL